MLDIYREIRYNIPYRKVCTTANGGAKECAMTEQEIKNLIESAVSDVDLADTEIPSIELYLDQILSIVSEKTALSAPRYRERALTKTMINNYSKSGLISPVNGKKYTRAQIVEMLLVYALKNTLSIDEIKRVLTGVREDCSFSGEDIIACYHQFLSLKDRNRERVAQTVDHLLTQDALNPADDKDFFLLLLDIISFSAYLKAAAQELLGARYINPEEREREKRETEEHEKRERKEKDEAQKRERKEKSEAQKRERKTRDAEVKATIKKLKEELSATPLTTTDPIEEK